MPTPRRRTTGGTTTRQYGLRSRAARRRRTVFFAAIAALVVVGVLVFRAATAPDDPPGQAGDPLPPVAGSSTSLDDEIAQLLADAGGYRVGVALADVSGDAVRTFGDDSAFFAASTAKIITAAAFYSAVEDGQLSPDERLGDFDAEFQVRAMVNDSSNDAWLLLMQTIGYAELTDYAASLGITYDPEENLLTATDLTVVLKDLYRGDLLNQEDTALLLEYMQNTNNEELIPAGSRPDVVVHHKYGALEGNLHDAALLSDGTAAFALVIFTEATEDDADSYTDTDTDTDQVELIRSLTRVVEDALFPTDG